MLDTAEVRLPYPRPFIGAVPCWLAGVACALFGALATLPAHAAAGALEEAFAAAAVQPERGLQKLQALRELAVTRHDLPTRLAADEAECQVRSEMDAARAMAVADAGLAAAGPDPQGAARDPWLRLRACRAAAVADGGQHAAGRAELDAMLALPPERSTRGARAVILLERGVSYSRSGELEQAQKDLFEACDTLKTLGEVREWRRCIGQLGNHYRGVGDGEEALRLLVPLRDALRSEGAAYEDAIYTYCIGGVYQLLGRWEDALQAHREAAEANLKAGDQLGVSYAERALADSLLHLGRPEEALQQVEQALARIAPGTVDVGEWAWQSLTRAEALLALGRGAQARAQLQAIEAEVRKRQEAKLLLTWLQHQARAMAEAGRWREAYEALHEAQDIQARQTAQKLSLESARLRMQFNRQHDADELDALRRLNDQGQQLRSAQAAALGLFVALLLVALVVVVRKVRQTRLLHALASTDELTGLPNRRAVLAYLEQSLAQAGQGQGPVSVLMIDVDHFKRVNDTQGHDVGDEVLRHLALTLGASLREHDRLGRLGGEEFVAVLPGTTTATAAQVAERMRAAVAASPLPRGQGAVPVTVSIGVAGMASGCMPAKALLAAADEALYLAKHAGRDRVQVLQTNLGAPT